MFFFFLWTLIWNKLKYPRVSPVGQVLFPALLVLWVYRHLPKNLPGRSGDWAALETHLEMSKSHLESASKSTKGGFFGCRMVPLWLSHFHCPEGPGQAKLASDLTCWLPFFFFSLPLPLNCCVRRQSTRLHTNPPFLDRKY